MSRHTQISSDSDATLIPGESPLVILRDAEAMASEPPRHLRQTDGSLSLGRLTGLTLLNVVVGFVAGIVLAILVLSGVLDAQIQNLREITQEITNPKR